MQTDLRNNNPHWICGVKFMKWGLGFFLFGILVGFGVFIHYLAGSRWNNSNAFLTNITLWFGSPLTLSVSYLQIGGLGMTAIGGIKLLVSRLWQETESTTNTCTMSTYKTHGHGSLILCVAGLIALFITGYIGYFIINAIWPGFYYAPIEAGKNLWLILQGLSILCYFIGMVCGFTCLCKCCCCCCKKNERLHERM